MAAPSREHYRGDAAKLTEALMEFATKDGPSFIKYADEQKATAQAKLLHGKSGVEGHYEVLSRLKALQCNLSFTRAAVLSSLDEVLATHRQNWRMNSAEAMDWRETIARRLRNMCRAVSQGESKRPGSSWVQQLPWRCAQAEPQTSASAKKADDNQADDGKVAFFDREVLLPWRPSGPAGNSKDFGLPIDVERMTREGLATATFCDGSEAPIKGVEFSQLLTLLSPRGRAAAQGELFSINHKESNHALVVKQKVVRSLLLVLLEQQRQVLMIRLDVFGHVQDHHKQLPQGNVVLEKGVSFMKEIAIKYSNGEVQRSGLSALRGQLLDKMGLKSRARKRPAAAAASSIEKPKFKKPAGMPKGDVDGDEQQGCDDQDGGDDDGDKPETFDERDQEGDKGFAGEREDDGEDVEKDEGETGHKDAIVVQDSLEDQDATGPQDAVDDEPPMKPAMVNKAIAKEPVMEETKIWKKPAMDDQSVMKRPASVCQAEQGRDEDGDIDGSPLSLSGSSSCSSSSSTSSLPPARPSSEWDLDEPPPPPTSFG